MSLKKKKSFNNATLTDEQLQEEQDKIFAEAKNQHLA
jgi:hypothetical protein